jgi:SAM-dependent methyltransferase
MSKLVGKDGFVSGIDMTENQLAVAQKYIEEQTIRFSYTKPNVRFILDDMEHIQNHFIPETVDLVTSNCVLNLAEKKEIVIKQIYDVLQFGGEFYFSDIYADRRIPDTIRTDPVLYGECLGGALYYRDFERMAREGGFLDPRVVSQRVLTVSTNDVKGLIGDIRFYSISYRLWKLKGLEDTCEDYGHSATYLGGIPETPFTFHLDGAHIFHKNKPERVCGNTARMLSQTRFKDYFTIAGDFKEHFGEFKDCSTALPRRDDHLDTVHSERCC